MALADLAIAGHLGAVMAADREAAASIATGWTVGLNWYLNENLKWMLDYERTSFEGGAAVGDGELVAVGDEHIPVGAQVLAELAVDVVVDDALGEHERQRDREQRGLGAAEAVAAREQGDRQ